MMIMALGLPKVAVKVVLTRALQEKKYLLDSRQALAASSLGDYCMAFSVIAHCFCGS